MDWWQHWGWRTGRRDMENSRKTHACTRKVIPIIQEAAASGDHWALGIWKIWKNWMGLKTWVWRGVLISGASTQHLSASSRTCWCVSIRQRGPAERSHRSINLNRECVFLPTFITDTRSCIGTDTCSLSPTLPPSSPVCTRKHMHLNQVWGARANKDKWCCI